MNEELKIGIPLMPIFLLGILFGLIGMAWLIGADATPQPPTISDACPESMVCYEPHGAPVAAEYVLDGAVVKVTFAPEEAVPGGEGHIEYQVDFEKNIAWCTITVPFPEQVLGDPAMDALGHEMLHCIVGDFHP